MFPQSLVYLSGIRRGVRFVRGVKHTKNGPLGLTAPVLRTNLTVWPERLLVRRHLLLGSVGGLTGRPLRIRLGQHEPALLLS